MNTNYAVFSSAHCSETPQYVRFEGFMVMTMQVVTLWVMTPYSDVVGYQLLEDHAAFISRLKKKAEPRRP
jgi:hypothetical protein